MRIKIIRIIIIVLFLVIVFSLFYFQCVRGRYFYHLSKNNSIRVMHLEGWRGRIFDRNGNIIADDHLSYNVTITPQDIKDSDRLFSFLAKSLDTEKAELIKRYKHKKLTPFNPVIVAEDVPREKAIVIEESKYLFPSLYVQKSFKRFYPFGKACSQVVGYIRKINRGRAELYKEYGYSPESFVGYSGIEEYYDSYLKGEEGGLQIEINSRGEQVRLLGMKNPAQGQDVTISIDADLQKDLTEILQNQIGSIILMDMDNGEILSMVSSPSYDPNIFIEKEGKKISTVFSNPGSPLLNRAIQGLYPPGSVFKVPMAVCALEHGKITPQTTFFCKGFLELGGRKFRCTHSHGSQNLTEALAHSCNVYFYHVGLNLGADLIHNCATHFGLGSQTHIDLPYEESGHIPSRRQGLLPRDRPWYTGDTLNFSIGQGEVLTTPIQLVKMMATVANNGREVQPHLIKKINGDPVNQYSFTRNLNIPATVFESVKKGLRAAVINYSGTAHVLDIKDLYVAGKTGTAQSNKNKEHHAWFVGYLKGKKNLAFCVFLEHGGSSQNACLVAREMLLKMQADGRI